ncbi:MAG: polymer-forming cytoskeletal protein [Kiloniellales bacterium]|nr:polymer-forming cytoskeletal protein [Kiloniellales bacterium]
MFGKSKHGGTKSAGTAPEATSRRSNATQGAETSGQSQRELGAPRVTDMTRRPFEAAEAGFAGGETEGKKLIVGREICLSGEIKTCDQLVVEGKVEATLTDSRRLEIASTGFFKGSASIQEADISGRYQGDLTVIGCLKIRATGSVEGEVRYGELEVERGGRLAGTVELDEDEQERKAKRLSAAEFVQAAATDGSMQAAAPAEKTRSARS